MRPNEINVGAKYHANVDGRMTIVEVLDITERRNPTQTEPFTYTVRNLATGKTVTFRSAFEFRTLSKQLIDRAKLEEIICNRPPHPNLRHRNKKWSVK